MPGEPSPRSVRRVHSANREPLDHVEGIVLASPLLQATFVPAAGMVGSSLRHGGDELLAQRGGLDAWRGSGKSFGYLIPILATGKKAVISTGTIALQEQLLNKDIPFLQQAFSTVSLSAADWLQCAAVGSSVLWLRELSKVAMRTFKASPRAYA